MLLPLSIDELLSTTRAVRKRLDLERPVEREVLEECLGSRSRRRRRATRRTGTSSSSPMPRSGPALAELWRARRRRLPRAPARRPRRRRSDAAVVDAVVHLAEHLHEVPVHVIPCVEGRTEGTPCAAQAGVAGARSSRRRGASCSPRARAGSARSGRASTSPRAGGRRAARHPLRRGDAGGADPGRATRSAPTSSRRRASRSTRWSTGTAGEPVDAICRLLDLPQLRRPLEERLRGGGPAPRSAPPRRVAAAAPSSCGTFRCS